MAKIDEQAAKYVNQATVVRFTPMHTGTGEFEFSAGGIVTVVELDRKTVESIGRKITEWYSDPTQPPPDAATLRKAEMFEELVAELDAAVHQYASGSNKHGATNSAVVSGFSRSIDAILAKAKAAKGGEG